MRRLYKRGRVYWVDLGSGNRQSLRTADPKIAQARAHDAERRLLDPSYRPTNATTLRVALRAFIDRQRDERARAPGTIEMYERHGRGFVAVWGADRALSSIGAPEIDAYLATRAREGASSQTRWKELCTLRGTLRLAKRAGTYPHDVAAVFPVGFEGRQSKPGTRHVLMPGVLALLWALPEERRPAVAFMVATGADWSSVARVVPADFSPTVVRVRGTKTDHRDRLVPRLPIFEWLMRLAEAGPVPYPEWTLRSAHRALERACKVAGLPRVTPRDLRRSCGRILRTAGVPPHLIALVLGHADGRMAERVYGRLEAHEAGALIAAHTGVGADARDGL